MSGASPQEIRLLILDVDGVLTDGRLYYGSDGTEYKTFHTHDGHGIRRLLEHGIEIAVISGRSSDAVSKRMQELGVRHVVQGCGDKVAAFEKISGETGIAATETAFVADDLPDIPLLNVVGMPITVANATTEVQALADWRTKQHGGFGAVREVCEYLIAGRRPGGPQ